MSTSLERDAAMLEMAQRGLYPAAHHFEILNHKGEVVADKYVEVIPPGYVLSDPTGVRRRDRRKAARAKAPS